jgi:hypothetical protein
MEEGDIGSEGYVIIDGEVEVFKIIQDNEVSLVRLGPGDTVGEMAMISPAPRSASVRALVDTEVVGITGDTMKAELNKLPPWMGHVVEALVDRLRGANEVVHPLMRGDCEYHVMYMFRHFATFWGMPVNDETSNGLRLVMAAEHAVNEAATILSLPADRAVHVLAILLDEGLLMPYDEDHCYIQNFELFDSFLSYVRQRLGIPTYFSEDYDTEAMAGDGEVLVRRTSPNQSEEEVEIEPTAQTNSAEIVDYSSPEELEAQFDRLFEALQGPGTPIEIEVDEDDEDADE